MLGVFLCAIRQNAGHMHPPECSKEKHSIKRRKNMDKDHNTKQSWALRDVIMMASLGLVFAIVYLAVFFSD